MLRYRRRNADVAYRILPGYGVLIMRYGVAMTLIRGIVNFGQRKRAVFPRDLMGFNVRMQKEARFRIILITATVPFRVSIRPGISERVSDVLRLCSSREVTGKFTFARVLTYRPLFSSTDVRFKFPGAGLGLYTGGYL